VSALVKLGARVPGSEALASARAWAQANASARGELGGIVIAAPLVTSDASGDALAEQTSGLAVAIEAARALAASGAPVAVVLDDGALASSAPLAGAALVVYVSRACGLPTRRDLLSHRVLRERFVRSAGAEPQAGAFEQARAPHAELLAAGARRVVAIDAPAGPGMPCDPGPLGDVLVRFVRDAAELLARSRVNARAPLASQHGS
jgi:hypothetical protein